ncbi:hypothetical protein WN51_01954 [Melipona quadrifasciata]|uniref:Uncharacterized protein n=1 Tax=Melipona quadrifasciata TaxID=166423 RepID=A0A0M9ABW2_9HYME|nr:hypothetical protein WN51_01954 [Melipona quadrifasciata]
MNDRDGIHMLLATMPPLTLVTLRYAVDYGSYMKRLDVAQHLEYPIHVQESAAPTLESVERELYSTNVYALKVINLANCKKRGKERKRAKEGKEKKEGEPGGTRGKQREERTKGENEEEEEEEEKEERNGDIGLAVCSRCLEFKPNEINGVWVVLDLLWGGSANDVKIPALAVSRHNLYVIPSPLNYHDCQKDGKKEKLSKEEVDVTASSRSQKFWSFNDIISVLMTRIEQTAKQLYANFMDSDIAFGIAIAHANRRQRGRCNSAEEISDCDAYIRQSLKVVKGTTSKYERFVGLAGLNSWNRYQKSQSRPMFFQLGIRESGVVGRGRNGLNLEYDFGHPILSKCSVLRPKKLERHGLTAKRVDRRERLCDKCREICVCVARKTTRKIGVSYQSLLLYLDCMANKLAKRNNGTVSERECYRSGNFVILATQTLVCGLGKSRTLSAGNHSANQDQYLGQHKRHEGRYLELIYAFIANIVPHARLSPIAVPVPQQYEALDSCSREYEELFITNSRKVRNDFYLSDGKPRLVVSTDGVAERLGKKLCTQTKIIAVGSLSTEQREESVMSQLIKIVTSRYYVAIRNDTNVTRPSTTALNNSSIRGNYGFCEN